MPTSIRRIIALSLPILLLGACTQTPATPPAGSASPLIVSDGGTALTSAARYDFQDGRAHTFAVAESGYAGAFAVSSSNLATATATVSGGVLTVTPGSVAGLSTITVSDTNAQSFAFTVSVTTASMTIN